LETWGEIRSEFNENEQRYAWGQLAIQAARKHDPAALSWFRMAGNSLSDEQLGWKVRAALRAIDWNEVLNSIQSMSESGQRESNWRYWKARALKAMGKTAPANAILAPLSLERNFYGQLATEELGVVIGGLPASYKPSADEIKAVSSLPAIQRALKLYNLNMRYEAAKEWGWAIRNYEDKHLLAAAELAQRNEWYERAINTADKTVLLHDFDLRYPSPYRKLMTNYTRQWDIDEAWVYGLIRQESRFVTQARSGVGASGLMQVMPSTAKWIAKRLGLKDHRQALSDRMDQNIEFGTYYLRYVLNKLDGQPVLATAAYNAGPVRANRWRDLKALEGAVYTESIPFTETRDYVKKVMSNAMYYAIRLGQKMSPLKERLGTIAGSQDNKQACSAEDERSPACEQ
jgi:soluble lytic murein transglycosylase